MIKTLLLVAGLSIPAAAVLADEAATTAPAATPAAKTAAKAPAKPKANKVVTTASGLKYEVLKKGKGATATAGHMVTVHYTGWLTNGTKFDSSVDRGQPFQFNLGAHQVIQGWDEGVAGMKIGEKRKLTIPSSLGYGAQGAGGVIPPNSTLIFDVELLGVQ
jgi:FKBP-type peptidyl-prolyl cis-trans isomerase